MRYRPDCDLVLKGLSFTVKPGTKTGIVGRTASGKSTTCLALTRIVEIEKGTVTIDGLEASKVDLTQLRSKITVIPQDPVIFDGTVKFNLDPEEIHSDADIENMMREAGLEELLKRTPEKYHTEDKELDIDLEKFGTGEGIHFKLDPDSLSAGEKQLICIARAVLRENKIVILDEATANIDIVTEENIQKLMNNHFKNSTVFTIAHRINTIINSDNVLVMDKGKNIEFGNPQKLSKDPKSEFYQLIQEIEKKEKDSKKD